MICSRCGTDTVEWKGPLVALTHTACSKCGGTDCQVAEDSAMPPEEGDECRECGIGELRVQDPETREVLDCDYCGALFNIHDYWDHCDAT